MAKELQKNVSETQESLSVVVEEKANEVKTALYLERKSFGKSNENGEDYFSYSVFGEVRGRKVKIDFVPKDSGGYEVLNIVFVGVEKAELIIGSETMVNESGKQVTYTTYKARSIDEDGNVWDCPIKPSRGSDKTMLDFLLQALRISK